MNSNDIGKYSQTKKTSVKTNERTSTPVEGLCVEYISFIDAILVKLSERLEAKEYTRDIYKRVNSPASKRYQELAFRSWGVWFNLWVAGASQISRIRGDSEGVRTAGWSLQIRNNEFWTSHSSAGDGCGQLYYSARTQLSIWKFTGIVSSASRIVLFPRS